MSTIEKTLIKEFEEFLTRYYKEKILELAKNYPDEKSLKIEFSNLEKFDPETSEKLLKEPDKTIKSAEKALKNIDLPVDKDLKDPNIRFIELPSSEKVLARNIRSHHIGNLISIEGIIRKATEVRPKLIKAHFKCVRCGSEQEISQDDSEFKEPYECKSCERKGPFDLNEDKSEFMDSQKLQIQEVPEELRGGEQPQDINVRVEDDITGIGVPGNRVIINGILRSYQKTNTKGKTNLFDVFIDCNSIEVKEQEFKEIEITEEEKEKIIDLSEDEDIYQKVKDSIAPTIYGYDKVKEAMALQLFSGVPKELPDGSRIRGDIHTLLVGDPGIGKCVSPETSIKVKDEEDKKIGMFVESYLNNPNKIEDGFYKDISELKMKTISLNPNNGRKEYRNIEKVWKREAPDQVFIIKTKTGKELEITPSHPLFSFRDNRIIQIKGKKLEKGDFIATLDNSKSLVENNEKNSLSLEKINLLNKSLSWEEITDIKKKEPEYDWVYDLEIKDNHNYLTNNIFSHNSQILRYVANLAPRGVYASGKSSTSAGLCVSPETLVPTSQGSFKIKNLVEKKSNGFKEIKPGAYRGKSNEEVSLFSLNGELKITKTNLDSLWKIEAPDEMIEIIPQNNKKIEVTPETALPIKNTEEIEWKKAKNVSTTDYLATPNLIETKSSTISAIRKSLDEIKKNNGNKEKESIDYVSYSFSLDQESIQKTKISYRLLLDALNYLKRNNKTKTVNDIINQIEKIDENKVKDHLANDVSWVQIKKINKKTPSYDFVYDVTVENHNFLANDLLVHNTAAAVRDEFGDGKWTLEAGALVLADKGIATIDEIDKMESKDRSALHEAMEQQSISIAKAGITATLQSRCALLGAANPKYGRFDEYEPIAEQIDLEPTLLSRFDLIFTIQDEPNEEKDSRVAEHIMTSHEAGEISKNEGIGIKEKENEEIEPEIEPDMLRKYIAFSKKVTPVLKPESKNKLRDFYLDLRKAGENEESPVPVTARQLEALIRLAEASARTRLSDEVTEKDAERAIKIVKGCLEEVGVDPETGELDIDVLTTGTSKSQRDKIRVIKDIIDEFDQGRNGAEKEEVIDEAGERGIDESDVRDIITRLRENGDIIEPITNKTLRTT